MKTCPRCLKDNMKDKIHTNALSRRDNKTYICPQCGMEEALIDAGLIKSDFLNRIENIFIKKIKGEE